MVSTCHFSLILTVLKVAEWPYTFTPIASALAGLVTQIYLGLRQVHRCTRQLNFTLDLYAVGFGV